jgi:hypothetical protein
MAVNSGDAVEAAQEGKEGALPRGTFGFFFKKKSSG